MRLSSLLFSNPPPWRPLRHLEDRNLLKFRSLDSLFFIFLGDTEHLGTMNPNAPNPTIARLK